MQNIIADNADLVAELKKSNIEVLSPAQFAEVPQSVLAKHQMDEDSMGYRVNNGETPAFAVRQENGDVDYVIFIDGPDFASGANLLDTFEPTVESVKRYIAQWV